MSMEVLLAEVDLVALDIPFDLYGAVVDTVHAAEHSGFLQGLLRVGGEDMCAHG